MKICAHFHTTITNRTDDILEIIDSKFLRYDVNNLVASGYIGFILIGHQLVDFFLSYFIFGILSHDVATGLQAFYMMSRNTYIYFRNTQVWIGSITIIKRHPDGFDGLIDIEYLAVFYTVGIRPAKSENFQFTEFVFTAGDGSNFCSTYVETYNNGLFLVHGLV